MRQRLVVYALTLLAIACGLLASAHLTGHTHADCALCATASVSWLAEAQVSLPLLLHVSVGYVLLRAEPRRLRPITSSISSRAPPR